MCVSNRSKAAFPYYHCFTFFPPSPFSKIPPSLFFPFTAPDRVVALVRCHAANGLTFFINLRSDEASSSGGGWSDGLGLSNAFFVAARVACPILGGVVGTVREGSIGVTRVSSSVSGARSVISLSLGRGGSSSMSVMASSSSAVAMERSFGWAAVGKRRRGLIDDRVKGRRRGEEISASSSVSFQSRDRGLLSGTVSSANLRNIFLPRLNQEN